MRSDETLPWWLRRRDELLDLAEGQANAFVYDTETVIERVERLRALRSIDRILFAMKSNFHPELLAVLAERGIDFECVSPDEVEHLLEAVPGLDKARVLFTPNFAPRADYQWAHDNDVLMTLDNLYPLQEWPQLFADRDLFVRIDPDFARGHHDHVRTAGEHSKFGIPQFELDELESLVRRVGANVIGIHAHSGSGIPEADTWGILADLLAEVADRFPDATVLDLGGGLGIPSRPGDPPFDLDGMDAALAEVRAPWPADRSSYRIWIEPGRYLVGESGILLTHVTQTKGKGDRRYIGVATGMNALIRPSLYGAHHEIVNLSRYDEPTTQVATIVGPICETGDMLGRDRPMPPCEEGDVMVIANVGAYGRVMSSQYNLRPVPDEFVI